MTPLKPHTCGQKPDVYGSVRLETASLLFPWKKSEVSRVRIFCARCGESYYGVDFAEAAVRWNEGMKWAEKMKSVTDKPTTWQEAYTDLQKLHSETVNKLLKAEKRIAELEREPDPYRYEIMGQRVTEGEYYKSKYDAMKKGRDGDQSASLKREATLASELRDLRLELKGEHSVRKAWQARCGNMLSALQLIYDEIEKSGASAHPWLVLGRVSELARKAKESL